MNRRRRERSILTALNVAILTPFLVIFKVIDKETNDILEHDFFRKYSHIELLIEWYLNENHRWGQTEINKLDL